MQGLKSKGMLPPNEVFDCFHVETAELKRALLEQLGGSGTTEVGHVITVTGDNCMNNFSSQLGSSIFLLKGNTLNDVRI